MGVKSIFQIRSNKSLFYFKPFCDVNFLIENNIPDAFLMASCLKGDDLGNEQQSLNLLMAANFSRFYCLLPSCETLEEERRQNFN